MSEVLRIAIVGSGPAALYAAAELAKQRAPLVQVNMLDRLPCIGGLVRTGVAPDHYERRLVTDAYEKLARSAGRFEFFGNVEVGRDITHEELLAHHHGVIYATGASGSQPLNIPGAALAGCHPSNEFVGWYNGHPDHKNLDVDLSCHRAIVIGNGNVALDIARLLLKTSDDLDNTDAADHARLVLAKSNVTEVIVIGRRGPVQASFTHPELLELGKLPDVAVQVAATDLDASEWPRDDFSMALRRSYLEQYAANENSTARKTLRLRFLSSPISIQGESRVASITVMKNRLQMERNGRIRAEPTEQTEELATGLVIHAIGYKASPIPALPFNVDNAIVPNDNGRVINHENGQTGTYVTGWIKRGPRGVIGSNKRCAAETVASLLTDAASGLLHCSHFGSQQFAQLLRHRLPNLVDYRGWRSIRHYERKSAVEGAPCRKVSSVEEMVRISKSSAASDVNSLDQLD